MAAAAAAPARSLHVACTDAHTLSRCVASHTCLRPASCLHAHGMAWKCSAMHCTSLSMLACFRVGLQITCLALLALPFRRQPVGQPTAHHASQHAPLRPCQHYQSDWPHLGFPHYCSTGPVHRR